MSFAPLFIYLFDLAQSLRNRETTQTERERAGACKNMAGRGYQGQQAGGGQNYGGNQQYGQPNMYRQQSYPQGGQQYGNQGGYGSGHGQYGYPQQQQQGGGYNSYEQENFDNDDYENLEEIERVCNTRNDLFFVSLPCCYFFLRRVLTVSLSTSLNPIISP